MRFPQSEQIVAPQLGQIRRLPSEIFFPQDLHSVIVFSPLLSLKKVFAVLCFLYFRLDLQLWLKKFFFKTINSFKQAFSACKKSCFVL